MGCGDFLPVCLSNSVIDGERILQFNLYWYARRRVQFWFYMFKLITNLITVITLMVALIGQAFAYTSMVCEMDGHQMPSHEQVIKQNSHSMKMDMPGVTKSEMDEMGSGMDCCEIECTCPANACMSLVLLSEQDEALMPQIINDKILLSSTTQLVSKPNSLYRPPISA